MNRDEIEKARIKLMIWQFGLQAGSVIGMIALGSYNLTLFCILCGMFALVSIPMVIGDLFKDEWERLKGFEELLDKE